MTFAERVISFNSALTFRKTLPATIAIMNPFAAHTQALAVSSQFYQKYYADNRQRTMILGINPGRFGAGVTGIPFTDTKRLQQKCNLQITDLATHELSAVFVYDVIDAYGGVTIFYRNFYINSVCPLGFVVQQKNGRQKNYNYYDSAELQMTMRPFIIDSIQKQIALGCRNDICFCMGVNKNYHYLSALNKSERFFDTIIPLEHPRYIMQYKLKQKDAYIAKYIHALRKAHL